MSDHEHRHAVSMKVNADRTELGVSPCTHLEYGAAGTLDRWSGSDWVPVLQLATYSHRGAFAPMGEDLWVKLIGYGGPRTLTLALPRLSPGRYRVRKNFHLRRELSSDREVMIGSVQFELQAEDA